MSFNYRDRDRSRGRRCRWIKVTINGFVFFGMENGDTMLRNKEKRMSKTIRNMLVLMVLFAAATSLWATGSRESQASSSQGKQPMTVTVATYQVQPTPPNAAMLPYFDKKFGVKLKILNINLTPP